MQDHEASCRFNERTQSESIKVRKTESEGEDEGISTFHSINRETVGWIHRRRTRKRTSCADCNQSYEKRISRNFVPRRSEQLDQKIRRIAVCLKFHRKKVEIGVARIRAI